MVTDYFLAVGQLVICDLEGLIRRPLSVCKT